MKTIIATLLALLLAGCGLGAKPPPVTGNYDFGLPEAPAPKLALKRLSQIEVTAPRWLDSVNPPRLKRSNQ